RGRQKSGLKRVHQRSPGRRRVGRRRWLPQENRRAGQESTSQVAGARPDAAAAGEIKQPVPGPEHGLVGNLPCQAEAWSNVVFVRIRLVARVSVASHELQHTFLTRKRLY